MAGRVLAQILLYSTQAVSRAFMEAYSQAAANAGRAGAAAAAGNAGARAAKKAGEIFLNGMSTAEARQILNIKPSADMQIVMKNFEHLFKVNEKEAGGSFYLQSKVVRAKEALEYEFKMKGKEGDTSPPTSGQNKTTSTK